MQVNREHEDYKKRAAGILQVSALMKTFCVLYSVNVVPELLGLHCANEH